MTARHGSTGGAGHVRARNDFALAEHFRLYEFECRCCGAVMVASRLPLMLEELRLAWGGPLVVTSGYRCESRNRTAGGAVKSLHLSGRAADIRAVPAEQAKLMSIARAVGFDEILPGGGKNYIHLACR